MACVEVLARLCAGTANYAVVGGGGVSELQAVEVSGFLAGLQRGPMLVAMAKYMGDQESRRWLFVDVYCHLLGVGQVWKGERADIADKCKRMAGLSLSEFIDDKCVKCHGTRFVKAKACSCCVGTGFKRLSGREVAKTVGVDESNFRRVWKPRYQSAMDRLRDYDAEVNRAVSRYNWDEFLQNT